LKYTFTLYNNWKDIKTKAGSFILEVEALRTALLHACSILSDPNFVKAIEDDSLALLSKLDPPHDTDTAVLLSAVRMSCSA